jgi:hypothetical protein
MCRSTGDHFEARHYQRLSKLHIADKCITNIRDLKSGDCIITFSRKQIFALKEAINEKILSVRKKTRASLLKKGMTEEQLGPELPEDTNFCSVIYGALPPETKQ